MITRRRMQVAAIAILVVIAAWLSLCYVVIADPTLNRLQKADAIFVLGGPDTDGRAAYGLQLAAEGYASSVAISVVSPRNSTVYSECSGGVPHLNVICFDPAPRTTQGEARQLRSYARAYGWKHVIVVTSSYHVSRARVIVERCFGGSVMMTSPAVHHSFSKMAYEFLYQSVGYVKAALVTAGC